ncbi:ABC transporter permease [Pseudobacter ginsenosidimutans]|uniref:Putative ABC transport system permease protein n=1 Tax=Pseudobacter ginsenosidimutans TaxID=661488 RepID=A0A4Q7MYD6_9BACT|nr:ABC transporter permease [Pseudobacter ginsenosidimutans]QEC41017.1 FtsX-like permease family protein [Pseudobacter ginsenosidimutans]RZS72233.1 putative ABC transport system permease protein [Pseudobacter ginsenosidimutans]
MFSNYFKTAWRNLLKNRFYTILNIGGLAVGLSVGILILLWVQDEFSFDRFHKQSKNIYRVENMAGTGSSRELWTNTAAPIGVMANAEVPGVEAFARLTYNGNNRLFKFGEKTFQEQNKFYADASLFKLFDFPIIKGDAANPFPDLHSIVITESTARKYFDQADPIGKVISAENGELFTVSGMIRDFPKNSSIQGDMFFPMALMAQKMYSGHSNGRSIDNDFSYFNYHTYLLLKPGMSLSNLSTTLRNLHLRVKPEDTDVEYLFLPLEKMHLHNADGTDGGIGTVRIFIIIAMFILLIACVNYVNLSTARAMLRAKEVSLRKIIGAARWQLFMQFIAETTLLFIAATIISLMLVGALIPVFNMISGKELSVNFSSWQVWALILITICGTLLLSGIYPAMLLSSFEPLKALRGKIAARISDVMFRRALVVVQFTFSVILITGTIIVGKQLSFLRSKQVSYNREHVLAMSMNNMAGHFEAVKASLLKDPAVTDVTWSATEIINNEQQTGDNDWDGKQNGETMMLSPMAVNQDFIPFFDMKLAAGKNFTGAIADSTHFILNETAVKAARIKDPIGKRFRLWKTEGTIIGVVKDFHFQSLRQAIKPAIFHFSPDNDYSILYIKTTGRDAPKAVTAAAAEWKKYNAEFPFSYAFLDDAYQRLYMTETRTGTLYNVFSGIAIFISCLGLLGLVTYTAQIRTREIGVRKVLGANLPTIIRILTSDLLKLVAIAIVIAVPLSWYAMHSWLQGFAYRIEIGWTVYAIAGTLAFLIAILTVSVQSVRAALANPVKSLRME